jgi:hypothetical protein
MASEVPEIFHHLFGRLTGPLAFRIVIQPVVAATFAVIAGLKDVREGRPPFGWTLITKPGERGRLLREGWEHVSKVFIAAIIIDFIYELIVLKRIYLEQTLIVATVLAVVPYLLIRGPTTRIARRWRLMKRSLHGKTCHHPDLG